jgi:cell division protein FtsI (penicillin-binding protein 3)
VVIQNSRESKFIYGADVSGIVFKEISDKLYGRYLSTAQYKVPSADSTAYDYYGTRMEVNTMLSWMGLSYTDSAAGNSWRYMRQQKGNTVLTAAAGGTAVKIVPGVVGMGLKDAIDLLENKGAQVSISGRGRVLSQSPVAGSPLKKGQTISLVLN